MSGVHDIEAQAGPIGDYAKIGTIRRVYERLDATGVRDTMLDMIAEATADLGTAEFVIEDFTVVKDDTATEVVFHIWLTVAIKGRVVE